MFRLAPCVGLLLLITAPALAGPAPGGADDSQMLRVLEVRRRQVELTTARDELKRLQSLVTKGFSATADVDNARMAVDRAQLDYQEALLNLLDTRPLIVVERAVKLEESDGRKFINLTIANVSAAIDDADFKLLNNFDGLDAIPSELRSSVARDVLVSIKGTGDEAGSVRGTTVGLPYEAHLPRIGNGEHKTIRFQLLKDVNQVMVSITWRNQTRDIDVQLMRADTGQEIAIKVTELSLEADLGGQVSFDVTLERPTVDSRRFNLLVLNLPQQINYSFVDPTNEARVSQFLFPAGVTQKALKLTLFLPERTDQRVLVDVPLEFYVAVATEAQRVHFQDRAHTYTAGEIRASQAGSARLELIPRGTGRIEVSAPSLFSEIAPGETITADVTLKNTGTRRLDNLRLWTEQAQGWRTIIEPDVIPALEKDREQRVKLSIISAESVAVGDYEVRIKTESFAYNRRVPAEDKIYRLSVKGRTHLFGILSLMALLLALGTGVVIVGVKLARR